MAELSLASYTDLKATIAATLMRGDLDDYIANWITMCEASMRRIIKDQGDTGRSYVEAGNDDDRYRSLPGDFYELIDQPQIIVGDASYGLDYVTPRLMTELWGSPMTGNPRFYTIRGSSLEMYPSPTGERLEITYRRGVIALATAQGGVNPLLTEAPDIYLYGSLIHSAPFLREDERLGTWTKFYTDAVADFNLAHQRKRFSGAPLTMRPRRTIG